MGHEASMEFIYRRASENTRNKLVPVHKQGILADSMRLKRKLP